MPAATPPWRSWHLWSPDLDHVLDGVVRPGLADLDQTGALRSFFFIRYGEGGPHLRVRLAPRPGWPPEAFRRRVEAVLARGCRITEERYEPEVERYGGWEGLAASERFFAASSRAVLAIRAEAGGWDTRRALPAALALHLALLRVLGLDRPAAARFLEAIWRDWYRQTFGGAETASPARLLGAFDAAIERQGPALGATIERLWCALPENAPDEPPWLAGWRAAARRLEADLDTAWQAGHLRLPRGRPWPGDAEMPPFFAHSGSIVADQMHLTNNRLGLANPDEIYLSYLLAGHLAREGACPGC